MEGGRGIYNWCMCVVSHGYGDLCGGSDGGGGWYATKPGELVACQETLEQFPMVA